MPSTPEPSGVDDDEKLRQIALMLADVKVVNRHVLIIWSEEISASADPSESESFEGKSRANTGGSQLINMMAKVSSRNH